jgi:squalene cyclase
MYKLPYHILMQVNY